MVRVRFFTLYPGRRSSHARVTQLLPLLRQAGLEVSEHAAVTPETHAACYAGNRWRRWRYHMEELRRRHAQLREVEPGDVVVVQKALTLPAWRWWPRMLARGGATLVHDIDDGVHLAPPLRLPYPLRCLEQPDQALHWMTRARLVVAGSPLLANLAGEHNANVALIPTTVDTQRWQPPPGKPRDRFLIVWMGTQDPMRELAPATQALRALGTRRPRACLRLVTAAQWTPDPDHFAPLRTEVVPWTREGEVEALRQAHVGLMPLEDTPWNRFKCGYKALLYMAVGAVPLVSPVGVNLEVIDNGRCGMAPGDSNAWLEALEFLMDHEDERDQLARRARRRVETHYSLEVAATGWVRALEKIRTGGPASPR